MTHQLHRAGRTAVLLDPHPFCHTAIAALLARFDTTVAGSATSADAALALLEECRPNLLVTELDLPEGRDEALRLLGLARRALPLLTVIVLSGLDDSELVDAAFAAGAAAYILKTAEPDAMATAINQAFEPSIYLARPRAVRGTTTTSTPANGTVPRLTRRELEILQLVSEGRSNRQVGKVLWVTDQTVKFHLANIYRKLGVRSRFDAARWAHEHGVLQLAESGELVTITEGQTARTKQLPVGPATSTVVTTARLREGTSR
jgi:DNA-binding NarL/FixJ family response regulator